VVKKGMSLRRVVMRKRATRFRVKGRRFQEREVKVKDPREAWNLSNAPSDPQDIVIRHLACS
jgi:hypothetical protein